MKDVLLFSGIKTSLLIITNNCKISIQCENMSEYNKNLSAVPIHWIVCQIENVIIKSNHDM